PPERAGRGWRRGAPDGPSGEPLPSCAVPLDPACQPIIELMEAAFPRIDSLDTDPAEVRAVANQMERLPPAEECTAVVDRTIPGPAGEIPVRIYQPAGAPPPGERDTAVPGVVYYHGGGWVICNLDTHDN